MNECKCLRCGFTWYPRAPCDYEKYGGQKKNHVPVRCASCRSKYWNKPYTRDYRATGRLNKGSIAYTPPLPFPSHDAGKVRSKLKFSQAEIMEMTPKERLLIKIAPTGKTAMATRKKFDQRAKAFPSAYTKLSRSIKPRVKRKTATQRGKTKGKTKS